MGVKKISGAQRRFAQHKDSMNGSFQHSRDLRFLKGTAQGRNPISPSVVAAPANRTAERIKGVHVCKAHSRCSRNASWYHF